MRLPCIVADLELIPDSAISQRFPLYFAPDRMHYSRNFRLSRDGIEPDFEAVVVKKPLPGQKVGQIEEVEGQISIPGGHPVILVQSLDFGQQWYVQDSVEEVRNGDFTARVNFGDKNTPSGKQFRVVVVVAESRESALKFKAGQLLQSLPANLPPSKEVIVVRE